jgi:hypothetical protein
MPRGVRIPGIAGGTCATEAVPLEDGVSRLRRSFERLKAQAPTHPSVIFGPMTHDEWIKINLRHAELHLSYLNYS